MKTLWIYLISLTRKGWRKLKNSKQGGNIVNVNIKISQFKKSDNESISIDTIKILKQLNFVFFRKSKGEHTNTYA